MLFNKPHVHFVEVPKQQTGMQPFSCVAMYQASNKIVAVPSGDSSCHSWICIY